MTTALIWARTASDVGVPVRPAPLNDRPDGSAPLCSEYVTAPNAPLVVNGCEYEWFNAADDSCAG